MVNLQRNGDFSLAVYHGFKLKKGYWYGINADNGNFIATSGWEKNGNIVLYEKPKNARKWKQVIFPLENVVFEDNPSITDSNNLESFENYFGHQLMLEEQELRLPKGSSFRKIEMED